jgi:hypothetical protein
MATRRDIPRLPADRQRKLVYLFEICMLTRRAIAFADAMTFAHAVWCAEIPKNTPMVTVPCWHSAFQFTYHGPHRIYLKSLCSAEEVLHEIAHAVVDIRYPRVTEPMHGATFMAIYIDLLSRYLGYPADTLRDVALAMGLPVRQMRRPKSGYVELLKPRVRIDKSIEVAKKLLSAAAG